MTAPRRYTFVTQAELERLALFTEEIGESLHMIGKIERHGYDSRNPDSPSFGDNRALLEREVADLLVAIDLLTQAGDIDAQRVHDLMVSKSLRVPRFLHHQPDELLKKLRDYYA